MEHPSRVLVRFFKGIGPKKAVVLAKSGIETAEDLLYYFPRRYEDRTNFASVSKLVPGSVYTVKGRVLSSTMRRSYARKGFSITQALVGDQTGSILCVWFNQPYLKQYLVPGTILILYAKVELYGKRLQMSSPEFEIVSSETDESLNINRIVPIYKLPEMMSQRSMRLIIKQALDKHLSQLHDFLPYDIRSKENLINAASALINIHFPQNSQMQQKAYERLAFEEFFIFQLPLALRKLKKKSKAGITHRVEEGLAESFISSLDFKLTTAQQKAIEEIRLDMCKPNVMHRLLQGDVGSGKTVVATAAALFAIGGGYQAALMVPTEILARQHYERIGFQLSAVSIPALKGRDFGRESIKIGLLSGSLVKKEKEEIYRQIREGLIDLVIGTHALLEGGVEFKRLGLVVIDEQHKFGVGQRALLSHKGADPDCLIMTATPIPRTLAITLYGDLDISVINELPRGRQPVETLLVEQEERRRAYAMAREELNKGKQVYIVYPVIEESLALDIAGAKKMYEELKAGEFSDYRMGLIHGKLKQGQQDAVMLKFRDKELDILVSTTVLEVGIDIPGATCMIIEHAQRFGLAQLHQLRGRVGRGRDKAFCILIAEPKTGTARARLEVMERYNDGFRIAEEDLKIRGPGEFFGSRQSGLSELKIADPVGQLSLLKKAREEALKLINSDPGLNLRQNLLLKEKLLQRFPEYEELVMVQ